MLQNDRAQAGARIGEGIDRARNIEASEVRCASPTWTSHRQHRESCLRLLAGHKAVRTYRLSRVGIDSTCYFVHALTSMMGRKASTAMQGCNKLACITRSVLNVPLFPQFTTPTIKIRQQFERSPARQSIMLRLAHLRLGRASNGGCRPGKGGDAIWQANVGVMPGPESSFRLRSRNGGKLPLLSRP